MRKPARTYGPDDLKEIWQEIETRFHAMTPAEKRQTFVDAGIFTPKGNPTKPYRGVFRKIPATKD